MRAELDKLSTSAPFEEASSSLAGSEFPAANGPLFVPIVLCMSLPDQALLAEEWHARQQVGPYAGCIARLICRGCGGQERGHCARFLALCVPVSAHEAPCLLPT